MATLILAGSYAGWKGSLPAEEVNTRVKGVRTMIEARNVFPLKALNAITIRDTADKVKIAEKIIEANDKAKAEVVVQVELVQLDISRLRESD